MAKKRVKPTVAEFNDELPHELGPSHSFDIGLSDPLRLNVAAFTGDDAAHALATIVAEETEREREKDRAAEPPRKPGAILAPLLATLAGEPFIYRPSESTEWFKYLARPDVLMRCADRSEVDLMTLCGAIIDRLLPPNWGEFFWMRRYLVAVSEHSATMAAANEALAGAIMGYKQAAEARRKQATAGGQASAAVRRSRARVSPEQARSAFAHEVADGRPERQIVGVLAKRLNVDPSHLRRLLKAKQD